MNRADQLVASSKLREASLQLRIAIQREPKNARAHLALGEVDLQLADPLAAERELQAALALGALPGIVRPKLAEAYLNLGRFDDALAALPAEGANPHELARALLLRGVAQIGLGDLTAARASLDDAEKADPTGAEGPSLRARLALLDRDYGTAETMVDQALSREPADVDALLMKIQLRSAAGDVPGAILAAGNAVERFPWSPKARLARANLLMKAGRDGEARADVDSVLSNLPRAADAIYLRAVLRAREGQYAEAASGFSHLYPVIQHYPRALYYQAVIAAVDGKPETAVALAHRYVGLLPTDVDGIMLLARAQITAGRPKDAVETLRGPGEESVSAAELDLLGSAFALAGDMPSARKAFERATIRDPNDPQVLAHLTLTQMQADAFLDTVSALRDLNPGRAESALERLRDQIGETEPVGILKGLIRLQRLDLPAAEATFSDVLTRFPGSVDAKLNLADVFAREGRDQEAGTLFADVLTQEPKNGPALNAYVRLLLRSGHPREAIQAVEAALRHAPDSSRLHEMLADVLVQSGDPTRAIEVLANLRSRKGPSSGMLAALSRAQLALGRISDANETLMRLLALFPGDLAARRVLVDRLIGAGDLAGAERSLHEAIAARPGNFDVLAAIVRLKVHSDGLEQGLAVASTLQNDPANGELAALLPGEAYLQAGRPVEAAQAFSATPAGVETIQGVTRLAKAYALAGSKDRAAQVLSVWLTGHPGDAEAAALLANLDVGAGRLDAATEHLEIVVAQLPNDATALNNLAWLYGKRHDTRALAVARSAYAADPNYHTADTLGWILLEGGDADGALPLLEDAHRSSPDDGSIAYHLATATDRLGRAEVAAKLLRQSLANTTAFEGREAARGLLRRLDPAGPTGAN